MPNDLAELVDYDLVIREPPSRWTFHKDGLERTIEPNGRIVIADAAAQRVVIQGGAGIGCLPSYLAKTGINAGSLVHLLPAWRCSAVDIHAVYPAPPVIRGDLTIELTHETSFQIRDWLRVRKTDTGRLAGDDFRPAARSHIGARLYPSRGSAADRSFRRI